MQPSTITGTIDEQPQVFRTNSFLGQVIERNGLVSVMAERNLDLRPLSLVLTSVLSTGEPLGGFGSSEVNHIIHIDGEMSVDQVNKLMESSSLPHDPTKIHYFTFSSKDNPKESTSEKDMSLANPPLAFSELRTNLQGSPKIVFIVNTLSTTSNHFLTVKENETLLAIHELRSANAAVIVFSEYGSKGSIALQGMSNMVFDVSRAQNSLESPINVRCVKHDAYTIDCPKPFCLTLSQNESSWTVSQENDPDETFNFIISAACKGKTQKEIGSFIGLEQYQVSRLLQKAEKLGMITRTGHTVKRI